MKIKFIPKVIIGSVFGIATTILGIIAAFFPGVFNLEKDDIVIYKASLSSSIEYKNFVNFLLKEQKHIVYLDITYFEKDKYFYTDIDNRAHKFNINNPQIKNGETLLALIDNNGYFHVGSRFNINENNTFLRENGGFGVWLTGNYQDGSDDKFYIIDISNSSNNNILYKWYQDKDGAMRLIGNFLVRSPVNWREYRDTDAVMSPQWYHAFCAGGDDLACSPIDVIELDPISQKDISLKNY